jgi:hypothetical protein
MTKPNKGGTIMIWAIASFFLFIWVIGLAFHVLGSYIHLFFALAVATILIRYIRGSTV